MSVIVRSSDGRINSREVRAGGRVKPRIQHTVMFVGIVHRDFFETWVQAAVLVDGNFYDFETVFDDPGFPDEGTFSVAVTSAGVITTNYGGVIAQATYKPVSYKWHRRVSAIQRGLPLAGSLPFQALDNYVCDDASDNFNRADGTLYTDPSTKWIELNLEQNIVSNEVVLRDLQLAFTSGAMRWETPTLNTDATASGYLRKVHDLNSSDDSWRWQFRLQNFIPLT